MHTGEIQKDVDEEIRIKDTNNFDNPQEKTKIAIGFHCEKCKFSADTMDHLNKHKIENHCLSTDFNATAKDSKSSLIVPCRKCSWVGKTNRNLNNHMYVKHSGKKVCKICEFVALSPLDLRRHSLKYHEGGLPIHSCNECEFKTHMKAYLKQHKLTRHEGIRYQCEECEYLATTKYSLRAHHESHHVGIRYSCDKCELKARAMSHLRRHKRDKHGEEIAKQCSPKERQQKAQTQPWKGLE